MDRRDLEILREALELEEEAVARYVADQAASADPRLVAYWESLRRNEAEHRRLIAALLGSHGAAIQTERP
jgi:rubrerythrin